MAKAISKLQVKDVMSKHVVANNILRGIVSTMDILGVVAEGVVT